MAHRSDREPGEPALVSRQSKPAKQSGTQLADTIRASGREKGRINRPDTRLHPTSRQNIKSSLATREPSTQDMSGHLARRYPRLYVDHSGFWRPEPESNRRARICSPLRNHSAIGPGRAALWRGIALLVKPRLICPFVASPFDE